MALAVYAHFFALFVAAAHFLSVFVGRRSRADRVRIAVASTAILVLAVPALLYISRGSLSAALTATSVRSLRLCEPGCATPTQDFRAATWLVLTHASARDQILFDPPYLLVAYDYYARLETRRANERVTPDKGDSFAHSTRVAP
jgi:hypothetical protein